MGQPSMVSAPAGGTAALASEVRTGTPQTGGSRLLIYDDCLRGPASSRGTGRSPEPVSALEEKFA